ncbi:MAG: type II toxin-antitoxin system RelE/ParE family toxin [Candidatus Krumholzibacteria bacterium]|nr:type II toxin-antitoxin system RelE/ParE family toxin [Candidatus Krumholzibacteria bacterium]
MKFEFHPDAKIELFHAIDYYETCEPLLGYDFALEVRSTIQNICDFPDAWPILGESIRRCLTRRFPYGVLYSIESDKVLILAVMPLHRDPDYWKNRLS